MAEYEPLILNKKIYDMMLYSHPKLLNYPNYEKYQLVRDISAAIDKMLELGLEIEAKNCRKTALRDLDITNRKLQLYVRMSFEIKRLHQPEKKIKVVAAETGEKSPPEHPKTKGGYIDAKTYEIWSGYLSEIGRIIGSLIKVNEEKSARKGSPGRVTKQATP